jgi:hypothetical protein
MAEKLYVMSDIKVPLIFKGKVLNFNKNKIHKSGQKISVSLIYLPCVLFSKLYFSIESKNVDWRMMIWIGIVRNLS